MLPDDLSGRGEERFIAVAPGSRAPAADPDESEDGAVDSVRSPHWLDEDDQDGGWRERLVPERFRGARIDPGRRGVVALALVGVVAALVTAVVVFRERPVAQAVPAVPAILASTTTAPSEKAGKPSKTQTAHPAPVGGDNAPAATGELVVSVVGLVHITGLVHLPAGARVADAIAAAGGAREGADLTTLNLAQRLTDGDQILVGPAAPTPGIPQLGSTTIGATGRTPASAPNSPATTGARINLNTATESDLDALPGVGPVLARSIIAWRTANGRFTDLEQLGDIDGIGPTRLARLLELVTL